MSREYTTTATLTVYGDETDCEVRAHVTVEPGLGMGGGGATIDGPVEAFVDGEWVDVATFGGPTAEWVRDALCDVALQDDSSQCRDEEDYE